jgi:hypothetical protein
MKTEFNNIDKRLESRGDLSETVRLADLEKDAYDAELEILRTLQDEFEKDADPGTSFLDWLKSKDKDYFKRILLSSGGSVKNKPKEPKGVKKIDLTQEMLKSFDLLSKLSDAERETIGSMLKEMLNPKD